MNMYVSNLGFSTEEEDLRKIFAPYGEVSSAKIIHDRETGKSRGFAFVEMSDETASRKAMADLNDTTIDGRSIKVSEAKPKEDKPSRNGSSFNRNRF